MGHQAVLTTSLPRRMAVAKFHIGNDEMVTIGQRMATAFARVGGVVAAAGSAVTGPATACYWPAGDGFDVAAGFPTATQVAGDGVVSMELPAVEVAHMSYIGPFEELRAAYDALREDVERRGRHLADGLMWEEYLYGADVPPDQARAEIFWPLQPSDD